MYKNSQVFNFTILFNLQNSRKLSARENLVFYSMWAVTVAYHIKVEYINQLKLVNSTW